MDVLFFLSFFNLFFICFSVGCTFICLWILKKKLISLSCTWIICWFILRSFWGWQLYLLQINKLQNGLFQGYFYGHYFYLFLNWDWFKSVISVDCLFPETEFVQWFIGEFPSGVNVHVEWWCCIVKCWLMVCAYCVDLPDMCFSVNVSGAVSLSIIWKFSSVFDCFRVWCWPPSAACVSVLAGVGSMCFSLAWCQWCLVLTTISLCFGVGQCQQRVFQSCLVSVVFWCWPPSAPCVSVLAGVRCQQCVSVLPGVSGVLVFSTISTLCFSVGRCQQCVFQSCLVSVVFWCFPPSAPCVSVLAGVSNVCFSLAWCQCCWPASAACVSVLIPEKVECLVFEADCLLDVDMFHFLVALTMTLPSLHNDDSEGQPPSSLKLASLPTGGLNDQHALMLVFIVHLVQVMLSYNAPQLGDCRGWGQGMGGGRGWGGGAQRCMLTKFSDTELGRVVG